MITTNKKPDIPVNEKDVNAAFGSAGNWFSLKWDRLRMIVKKLQLRITKATQLRKFRKVKTLQWILTHSFAAKAIAVRNV